MSQTFAVMDENPNMGHGCLCSEIGTQESHGPFVVFSATEMDTTESPFPVLCAGCVRRANLLVDKASVGQPRKQDHSRTTRGKLNLRTEDGPSI